MEAGRMARFLHIYKLTVTRLTMASYSIPTNVFIGALRALYEGRNQANDKALEVLNQNQHSENQFKRKDGDIAGMSGKVGLAADQSQLDANIVNSYKDGLNGETAAYNPTEDDLFASGELERPSDESGSIEVEADEPMELSESEEPGSEFDDDGMSDEEKENADQAVQEVHELVDQIPDAPEGWE